MNVIAQEPCQRPGLHMCTSPIINHNNNHSHYNHNNHIHTSIHMNK